MNLTDVQVELRSIEEQIIRLHNEIEEIKPKTEDKMQSDFDEITKLALQYPIVNKSLSKEDDEVKKQYISGLSYLISSSDSDMYSKLLYLTRLAVGIDKQFTAEKIYQYSLQFKIESIDTICQALYLYKYSFLADALVISNISGKATKENLEFIAHFAEFFKIIKDEMIVIAQVAKVVLNGDIELLDNIVIPNSTTGIWGGKFEQYITDEVLEKIRVCVRISKNNILGHGCLKQDYSLVKKGDICLYYMPDLRSNKEVIAPKSGIVSYINNNEAIYVFLKTSPFDTDEKFNAWKLSKVQE